MTSQSRGTLAATLAPNDKKTFNRKPLNIMKIIVDQQIPETKSSLPLPNFEKISTRIIDVGSDVIKSKFQETISDITEILANVKMSNEKCKISEAKFTLTFSASGEVALMSIAKGALSGTSGIEFTVTF